MNRLVEATLSLDRATLETTFAHEMASRGALDFFDQIVLPFLAEVGELWLRGEIAVFQEHFASEQLTAFLASRWYAAPAGEEGYAVLATLENEEHVLGLHMVATALTLIGWSPIFLGRNTPVSEVVAAVQQIDARVVGVSSSTHADPEQRDRHLRDLRASLPAHVTLFIGGGGAHPVDGVEVVTDLRTLGDALQGPDQS